MLPILSLLIRRTRTLGHVKIRISTNLCMYIRLTIRYIRIIVIKKRSYATS